MEVETKVMDLVVRIQLGHKHFREVFAEYYDQLSRSERVLFAHSLDKPFLPYMDNEEQFYAFIYWMTGRSEIIVHREVLELLKNGNSPLESIASLALKYVRKRVLSKK